MDIHSARAVLASVSRPPASLHVGGGPGVLGFGVGGGARTSKARQAGVAVGLKQGRHANDAQIGLMIVLQNQNTQTFVDEMINRFGPMEIDVQNVGPMSATGPVAPPSALYYQGALRPVVPGASIGNVREQAAGTLGGFVQHPDGSVHVLSNNHVLANSSTTTTTRAAVGDAIVQPGPFDGGTNPPFGIGTLSNSILLDPTTSNFVDCATAALVGTKGVPDYHNRQVRGVRAPRLNERVFKLGRSTGETFGRIYATETSEFPVAYHGQQIYFDDQIAIQGEDGHAFSERGDSGALVVACDDLHAVGLLFAGNANRTLACPIERVLSDLNVGLII